MNFKPVQAVSQFNGWAKHFHTCCTTPKMQMPVVTHTAMPVRLDFFFRVSDAPRTIYITKCIYYCPMHKCRASL